MIGTDLILFSHVTWLLSSPFYAEEKANILQIQPRQMHHVLTLTHALVGYHSHVFVEIRVTKYEKLDPNKKF